MNFELDVTELVVELFKPVFATVGLALLWSWFTAFLGGGMYDRSGDE